MSLLLMMDFRYASVGFQLRVPISVKLIVATIALILAVVVPVALRNSELFEASFSKSHQDASAELAHSKSTEVDSLLRNYLEKIRRVTSAMLKGDANGLLAGDLDLVNVEIYELKNGRPEMIKQETNETYLREFDLTKDYINRVRLEAPFAVAAAFSAKDKFPVRNSTLPKGAPLFSIGVPFPDTNGIIRHVALADIRLDQLQKAFSLSGVRVLYLVDSAGFLLAHSDDKLVFGAPSFAHVPIVADAISKRELILKGQKRFQDPLSGERLAGAYSKTDFGLAVIAQTPESIVLDLARQVRISAYEWAGYAISVAIFLVILFSVTLTIPIEKLHEATLIVAQGNFNVKAKVRSSDEVGELAKAFNNMVDGLKEREKVKSILNKFHGSSITEDLLKGELSLGGSRKDVTVFFSDIRDFTKFSEGHTPEEVVEMLNEYFHIMVSIITANHGVVDKFVGDAIMAVWGAPKSTGADEHCAVKACLEMRVALAELNAKRGLRGETPIRIGMGVHTGPAISGKIGSTERMEYTVIGDTVNMASRIEAATKAFGVDLLISETTAKAVGNAFMTENGGSAVLKGKSSAVQMLKVLGYVDAEGKQVPVKTEYSEYAAEAADKVKISA